MRFRAPLILCCLCYAGAAFASDTAAPGMPDFSVLTPSMDGPFIVTNAMNPLDILPYVSSFANLDDRVRSARFRKFIASERYDPTRSIADRLVEALASAGYGAVYEPIARKPPGKMQSLAWSDLPEKAQGKLFLDVNIRWICLCSGSSGLKYRAGIAVAWRLLDPRQEVVEPTRTLVYVHDPGWGVAKPSSTRTVPVPTPEPRYPAAAISERCGYVSMDDAFADPQSLWGCFGEAYDVAIERLVIDLKRLRPPAAGVTASGDNPSGTSTQ